MTKILTSRPPWAKFRVLGPSWVQVQGPYLTLQSVGDSITFWTLLCPSECWRPYWLRTPLDPSECWRPNWLRDPSWRFSLLTSVPLLALQSVGDLTDFSTPLGASERWRPNWLRTPLGASEYWQPGWLQVPSWRFRVLATWLTSGPLLGVDQGLHPGLEL